MRLVILSALVGALTFGCTQATPEHEDSDTRVLRYSAGDDHDPAVIQVRGVSITVSAPVANALSIVSDSTQTKVLIGMNDVPAVQPGEDPACRFWLRGQPIVVSDGHLHVGSHDYGAVAAGDAVLVDAGKVSVNGTARGELQK